jgi:hypothetical protein
VRHEVEADNEHIAKLPKWAQDHISSLVRNLEDAHDHIVSLGRTVPKGERHEKDIVVGPYSKFAQILKADQTVRFWVDPDKFAIDIHMRRSSWFGTGPALTVQGYGIRTASRLIVHPGSSNTIYIGGEQ